MPQEFEVEVDQRLWAKHTEHSNKPTNPVAGPDTSITTGPGASKDAWSTRFLPSVSAPVRGRGTCEDLVDPLGVKDVKVPAPRHHTAAPVLAAAILAPLSALDKPGTLYVFDIPADQPNLRTCRPSHGRRYGWLRFVPLAEHPLPSSGQQRHPVQHALMPIDLRLVGGASSETSSVCSSSCVFERSSPRSSLVSLDAAHNQRIPLLRTLWHQCAAACGCPVERLCAFSLLQRPQSISLPKPFPPYTRSPYFLPGIVDCEQWRLGVGM
ncbi:hypothetical protein B0H10DRAFT_2238891 [Mycena sp. CBHHK59/15]|nr:hypothetical protein B0H10DRAFT_2238891 [Mycena sp. CBHHK59/15]